MVDQNTFLDTLNSVKEIIATAEVPLKEDEILAYFKDMELDGSQKAMVIDYLTNPDNYKESKENDDSQSETEENRGGESPSDESNINVYQMYLEELGQLSVYSVEEVEELYRLLLQGDNSVIEKISHAWLLRVTNIAQQYMEPSLLLEDLVQEGNMALFLELSRLCGSMEKGNVEEMLNRAVGNAILAYAGELRDAKELEDSIVGKVNLVNAAKTILAEENNVMPSVKELADYTKMSEKELEALLDIMEEANKDQ
ncbi:MAG: hypothetical protein ACI4GW_10495 [Lachnospiraceae bacterium]